MTRERIYLFDTTLRDGQQTHPPSPQVHKHRGQANKKSRANEAGTMTRERIYLFDTTLRDGQQTHPPCPQVHKHRGQANRKKPGE